MAVVIHTADIPDQDGAKLAIALWERFHRLKVIFADNAYKRCGLLRINVAACRIGCENCLVGFYSQCCDRWMSKGL